MESNLGVLWTSPQKAEPYRLHYTPSKTRHVSQNNSEGLPKTSRYYLAIILTGSMSSCHFSQIPKNKKKVLQGCCKF